MASKHSIHSPFPKVKQAKHSGQSTFQLRVVPFLKITWKLEAGNNFVKSEGKLLAQHTGFSSLNKTKQISTEH